MRVNDDIAVLGSSGYPCEEVPSKNNQPMMFPEEFEFITKLMANRKPETYLEWGCGTSTSFYPLLASGKVVAIDGYPPWEVLLCFALFYCLCNNIY